MRECPKCKSADLRRSRSRSIWERWRRQLTSTRKFTCNACHWRGWSADTGAHFDDAQRAAAARAIAPDPPNLKGTLLVDASRRPKPLDLDALDVSLTPLHDSTDAPSDDPRDTGSPARR